MGRCVLANFELCYVSCVSGKLECHFLLSYSADALLLALASPCILLLYFRLKSPFFFTLLEASSSWILLNHWDCQIK